MKICMLQFDVVNGHLEENAAKLAHLVKNVDADLLIAPRQALSGPGPFCDIDWPDQGKCKKVLADLAIELKDRPPLLCGCFGTNAALVDNGIAVELPSWFFFQGRGIALCDGLGVGKCVSFPQNMDIMIQLDAQPYKPGSQALLERKLGRFAASGMWLFSVNLCGGYGGHVYNGQSFAINPSGRVAARGAAFGPESIMVDTSRESGPITPNPGDLASQWDALVAGTRDFVRKAGASQAVLGLSGGMDSALVACIAVEALGAENVMGVMMPSPFSSESSITDSQDLARNLGMKTFLVPIAGAYESFKTMLDPALGKLPKRGDDVTYENMQARIRGLILMAFANTSGALVLNTGNKSEAAMGYCTLYGDTVGALAVIGDIFKTRVYELAKWYCDMRGRMVIPQNIFDKAPSAELRPNQKDTDSLPPYAELDPQLEKLFSQPEPAEDPALDGLRQKVCAQRFKRGQCPPPLLVG